MDTVQKINLLQAGGRTGRGPIDQTFIFRSLINHALYLGKTIFAVLYDYKQCFDKMWLQEAIMSLWRLGLSEELAMLIHHLNETSSISVKKPIRKDRKIHLERCLHERRQVQLYQVLFV